MPDIMKNSAEFTSQKIPTPPPHFAAWAVHSPRSPTLQQSSNLQQTVPHRRQTLGHLGLLLQFLTFSVSPPMPVSMTARVERMVARVQEEAQPPPRHSPSPEVHWPPEPEHPLSSSEHWGRVHLHLAPTWRLTDTRPHDTRPHATRPHATRPHSHSATQTFGHTVTRPHSHLATQSLGHTTTRPHSHWATSVIWPHSKGKQSLGHISHSATQ